MMKNLNFIMQFGTVQERANVTLVLSRIVERIHMGGSHEEMRADVGKIMARRVTRSEVEAANRMLSTILPAPNTVWVAEECRTGRRAMIHPTGERVALKPAEVPMDEAFRALLKQRAQAEKGGAL